MTTTELSRHATAGMRGVSPLRLAVAAAGAVALNLIALGVGSMAGASWETGAPESIDALTITVATLLPLLLAGVVTGLIARRRPSFRRTAAWIGLAFGFAGLPMPFIAAGDLATAWALAAMHVITAVAWFIALMPRLGNTRV